MQYQNIKTADAYESPTNPRGTRFSGPAFDDLVASINAKGILFPVVVRKNPKNGKTYEVVAGNRRLRAATKANLAEIPAKVMTLTDDEAREIQIIENLQREDVHPLEEGEAYRQLIEKSGHEVAAVAAKVGKSESYIRQRLSLTNLSKKAAAAYREDRISAGHAVLVARLETDADQEKLVKFIEDREADVADTREWIREFTLRKLSAAPPWKDHAALVAAKEPCAECGKRTGPTLFGENEANQCGDPRCFARRLAAHIALVKEDFAAKKTPLSLVAGGYVHTLEKGVLSYHDYRKLGAKEKCPSEHAALVVQGDLDDGLGEVLRICTDKGCKVHGAREGTVHRLTPKELAARRAAVTRAENKKKAEARRIEAATKKVGNPLAPKAIEALLEIMIREVRADGIRDLVKAKGWTILRKKETTWDKRVVDRIDYELTLRTEAMKLTDEERLRLVFSGFITSSWDKNKVIKLLSSK